MATLPSLADLSALPKALRTTVPAQFSDANGHMNIRHYMAVHDDAWGPYADDLGIGAGYLARTQRSFFDLEHHLRYYAEVAVGDTITARVRLLGRTPKVVHLMSFLVNETREELANTLELTTAHVDLRARRTVALESPDSNALDARLALDRALTWPPPLCGSMGLRASE